MIATIADIMFEAGWASQAPFRFQRGGKSRMNGMSRRIWREMDRNMDTPARPISHFL